MKANKNVVIKQSIIPELVSGSSTQAVTQRQALKTLKKFQGLSNFTTICGFFRGRHAELVSASSRYDNNKTLKQVQGDGMRGFTLIELLVVVLIIGILAAVALPQYNRVVEKSSALEALTILKAVQQAERAYYLEHGKYALSFQEMDIDIPWEGNEIFSSLSNQGRNRVNAKSNGKWSVYFTKGGAVRVFMGRLNGKYAGCGFAILYHFRPNEILCFEPANYQKEGDFCTKLFGGVRTGGVDEGKYFKMK